MKNLSMVSLLLIIVCVTIACTGTQAQNQVQPAPLGYIPIPTKDEILANAQFGIEQPEIIYARLLFSQEATQAAGIGVMYDSRFRKPDDPVWVVAVRSGNNSAQLPDIGQGDTKYADMLWIINAADGQAISMTSIQTIDNHVGLQRLKDLPDRDGTIEIQPRPIPTAFIPPPTSTAMPIASSVLESPNQNIFTSPLPASILLSPLPAPDVLDAAMRRHAGANYFNCGVVPVDGETAAANKCVDDAYQAKQAFIVAYYTPNIDLLIVDGLAGNVKGEIRAYRYGIGPFGVEGGNERECRTIVPKSDFNQQMRGCE